MRIAIFGVGCVGGYFGWRLARSGEEVVFIARGESLRALSENGLTVETPDGKSFVQPVNAVGDPAHAGPVDAVILGVKAGQVAEAAQSIRPLMGPETFVVPLQNGVESPSILADTLGAKHSFGGLCYIAAAKVAPAHIRHVGMEPRIIFGELDNRRSERALRLLQAFERAEVSAEIPTDIQVANWSKFLFIATMSGVGAISRAPVSVTRSIPETRQALESVAKEIVAVARAKDINLEPDAMAATMRIIDGLPPAATASMQRDINDGLPSELYAQSGAVVRLGREVGVEVPINNLIFGCLLPLEKRARGEVQF
jgi:2-dehydropantoate 2-reductase